MYIYILEFRVQLYMVNGEVLKFKIHFTNSLEVNRAVVPVNA